MSFVFALDSAGLAGAITVAVAGCLLTGLIALHVMHLALQRQLIAVPVAPYFVAVTTVWALLLGFVAADSWAANNEARRILNEERSAIQRLEGLARIDAIDLRTLGGGVTAYAAAVVEGEWGRNRNRTRDPAVEAAIEDIRRFLVEAALSGLPDALANKAIVDFDELQDARNHRLSLGEPPAGFAKWHLLLVLTALAHVAIAMVHADRPSAAWPALLVFSLACWTSLFLLALHAHPYDGAVRLEPSGLLTAW